VSAAAFAMAVRRMAEVRDGRVEVSDFYPSAAEHRAPYRYAYVAVECPHTVAPDRARELAALAVQVGGYLTMHVLADRCDLQVAISRDLDEDELREPGTHSLPVSLDEAVRS
jgi:hypothetical protein